MSANKKTSYGGLAWAGIAAVVLAVCGPARAQAPGAAHVMMPAVGLTVPAAAPPGIPAVIATARPLPPTPPAKPVALPPAAAAPLAGDGGIAANACNAPPGLAHFEHALEHTARRLASGKPLTIVAVGSSSTAGAGASSPAASYPGRLAVELRQRFPGQDITVLNRGVNGEEAPDMLARFASGVIAEHPQLVIWQLGTNSVLRDRPLTPHALELRGGIAQVRAAGADIVLIDPQYAPKVLAKSETPGMVDLIALAAKQDNVDLFPRFAIMRNWREVEHLGFDAFLSPDQLHMNDWSYACVAKLLAAEIAEAATRPYVSVAARPAH